MALESGAKQQKRRVALLPELKLEGGGATGTTRGCCTAIPDDRDTARGMLCAA